MKRKNILPVVFVLCIFVFAGCQCKHEWAAADCMTPKTCQKCEETEGEALGHTWKQATCAVPKTCSVCGETEGNVLAHTFGNWEITDTEMRRECVNCTFEEVTEADRSIYLAERFAGDWTSQIAIVNDSFYDVADRYSLTFSDANSFTLILEEETINGTWEFDEYEEEDGYKSSTLLIYTPSGFGGYCYLNEDDAEGDNIMLHIQSTAGEMIVYFIR